MAPLLPPVDPIILSDDESIHSPIAISLSSKSTNTLVLLSSDEEGDDASSLANRAANSKGLSTEEGDGVAASLAKRAANSKGSATSLAAASSNNGGGGGDNNNGDNFSFIDNNNTNNPSWYRPRKRYKYWHSKDIERLLKTHVKLLRQYEGAHVSAAALWDEFMQGGRPIRRGPLTERNVADRMKYMRGRFKVMCNAGWTPQSLEEKKFFQLYKEAWPEVMEEIYGAV